MPSCVVLLQLIDGAKRYIDWILHDKGLRAMFEAFGLTISRYVANNTIGFALPSFMDPRKINIIKARPKTADSCRGDAPKVGRPKIIGRALVPGAVTAYLSV